MLLPCSSITIEQVKGAVILGVWEFAHIFKAAEIQSFWPIPHYSSIRFDHNYFVVMLKLSQGMVFVPDLQLWQPDLVCLEIRKRKPIKVLRIPLQPIVLPLLPAKDSWVKTDQ